MRKRQPMLGCLLMALAGLPACRAAEVRLSTAAPLLPGVTLRETTDQIEFSHDALRVTFDRSSGRWTGLFVQGIDQNLITPSVTRTLDFRIAGRAVCQEQGMALRRWHTEADPARGAVHLYLEFQIPSTPNLNKGISTTGAPVFEVTCVYTLRPGQIRVDRSLKVRRLVASDTIDEVLRFEGFDFRVSGTVLAEPQACVVDVPGPFWPKTYLRPETPYRDLVAIERGFHSAPDAGLGLVAITNKPLNMTLASWMDTAGQVNYHSSLQGDGKRLTLHHSDERAYRLKENMTVCSDVHRIEVFAGGLPAALAAYRQMCEQRMPLDAKTPSWAREMILLEAYLPYYPGGFKELENRLSCYRDIGFNTTYLMPHWIGGYSPIDLFQVEPRFGTQQDLKELVATAHGLGMRVLFDMVIHGFNENSPVPKQRPEMFVHNEDGSLARHRTWKSISTDWASSAYRQYMVDLVRHDLATYDIDGYRVDAASYKGPNWDPNIPYPAYESGTAAPELMQAMLAAMRKVKPDSVLLSEVFGPAFYSVCNLAHDNQTEAPQFFLEQMEAGQVNATDYRRHVADVFDALPHGANRVYYARNHDTSWFYHFNGYTRQFMALEAVHALCAIPEVFAGDPKHGPHPDDDPAVYAFYRKLFSLRSDFPELARGELLLRQARGDNPMVFTALRRLGSRQVLVVISFSDRPERLTVAVDPGLVSNAENIPIRFTDPITGQTSEAQIAGAEAPWVNLALEPFQVLVGRL